MEVIVADLRDVARPGHRRDEVALRQRRRVVVARELTDLLVVGRLLDPVEGRVEGLVGDLRRVVAVREHHERERVAHRVEDGDLPFQLRVPEQLVDREHRVGERVVVGDTRHARLPRQREFAVRVEVRVLLDVDQVLDVGDGRLVELLGPPLLDHLPEVAVVVGEDDDVPAGRLAARELPLDLPVEPGVVVDVLDVVDVHAELLLELEERRERVVLLVRVHVERPVREVKSARKLLLDAGRAAGGLRAAAAAGGEDARDGDRGSSDRCALQQLPPGEVVGHSAPSVESTTNVESGLHEISLGACSAAPGSLFWT